jgi:alpha-galactosidase
VAERVHELGLKLGIYSDAAELTCGGCYGSLGHEQVDAEAYAEWGVDLLKYDYCHAPVGRDAAIQRYGAMGRALAGADRSIVFSVCEWGLRQPWRWAADLGGSYWRTTRDIFDSYSWLPLGVRGLAARNVKLNRFARPGHWNDPDMLLVGNRGRGKSTGELRLPKGPRPKVWSFRGITDVQAHSHMTLWSMMAAPLLTSHDLASTGEFDRRLLTNPEILAINQDELGVQARKVSPRFRPWVLAKPLVDGSMAVSITNMGRRSRRVQRAAQPGGLARHLPRSGTFGGCRTSADWIASTWSWGPSRRWPTSVAELRDGAEAANLGPDASSTGRPG